MNLATRVMSNGVEVIVADRFSNQGENLRIAPTSVVATIASPSTITEEMLSKMPAGEQAFFLSSIRSQSAHLLVFEQPTTYVYVRSKVKNGKTTTITTEDLIINTITKATHDISATPTINKVQSTVYENFENAVYETKALPTTYTYFNTIVDEDVPIVVTSKQTIANTVTKLLDTTELQPSEQMYDTNTYFSTHTFTKTLENDDKLVTTKQKNIVTQVIVTEAPYFIAQTLKSQKVNPTATTDIVKTYFVTYTYLNTYLENGSTVIKTNIATSSDVVTEKFYRNQVRATLPESIKITAEIGIAPSATVVPDAIKVYATKTYLTTFTYFTTFLEGDKTVTSSSSRVTYSVQTEPITAGLDSAYLDSIRSSFAAQSSNKPIITTVMLAGEALEITAINPNTVKQTIITSTTPVESSVEHIVTASTLNFIEDVKIKPTASVYEKLTSIKPAPIQNTDTPEYLLSNLDNIASSSKTNQLLSTISVPTLNSEDEATATVKPSKKRKPKPSKKKPSNDKDKLEEENSDGEDYDFEQDLKVAAADLTNAESQVSPDFGVNNLLTIGQNSINAINALKPVFSAVAGLISNNFAKKADTPPPQSPPNQSPNVHNKHNQGHPLFNEYVQAKHPNKPAVAANPIYIPVRGLPNVNSHLASEKHIPGTAESVSPNLPLEDNDKASSAWIDSLPIQGVVAERIPLMERPVQSQIVLGKHQQPLESPIIQDGIPIQPGQIITANSDVIVGRPSVLGQRPRLPIAPPNQHQHQPPRLNRRPNRPELSVVHNDAQQIVHHKPVILPQHSPAKQPPSNVAIGMKPPPPQATFLGNKNRIRPNHPPTPDLPYDRPQIVVHPSNVKNAIDRATMGLTQAHIVRPSKPLVIDGGPTYYPGDSNEPIISEPIPLPEPGFIAGTSIGLAGHDSYNSENEGHIIRGTIGEPPARPQQLGFDESVLNPQLPGAIVLDNPETMPILQPGSKVNVPVTVGGHILPPDFRDQKRPAPPQRVHDGRPPPFRQPQDTVWPGQVQHHILDSRPGQNIHHIPIGARPVKVAPNIPTHHGIGIDHKPHEQRQPEHRQPDHRQPDHRQPDHRQPDHRQPDHRQPDHRKPEHRQPDHRQPEHRQPEHRPHGNHHIKPNFNDQTPIDMLPPPEPPRHYPENPQIIVHGQNAGQLQVISVEPHTYTQKQNDHQTEDIIFNPNGNDWDNSNEPVGSEGEEDGEVIQETENRPLLPNVLPADTISNKPVRIESNSESVGFPREPINKKPFEPESVHIETVRPGIVDDVVNTGPNYNIGHNIDSVIKTRSTPRPFIFGNRMPSTEMKPPAPTENADVHAVQNNIDKKRPIITGNSQNPRFPVVDTKLQDSQNKHPYEYERPGIFQPHLPPSSARPPSSTSRPNDVASPPLTSANSPSSSPRPVHSSKRPPTFSVRPILPNVPSTSLRPPFIKDSVSSGSSLAVPPIQSFENLTETKIPPRQRPPPPGRPIVTRPTRLPTRPVPEEILQPPAPPAYTTEIESSIIEPEVVITTVTTESQEYSDDYDEESIFINPTKTVTVFETVTSTRPQRIRTSVRTKIRPTSVDLLPSTTINLFDEHRNKVTETATNILAAGIFNNRPRVSSKPYSNIVRNTSDRIVIKPVTSVITMPSKPSTRYITQTETLTITATETTVISSRGQPYTRTVIVTQTEAPRTVVSTIVGTITEIHTIDPSTYTTTISATIATKHVEVTTTIYQPPYDSYPSFTIRPIGDVAPIPTHVDDDEAVLTIDEGDNEVNKAVAPVVVDSDFIDKESKACEPECKVTKNEMCKVYDGAHRCVCRPGFARTFFDRPCTPTYTYQMKMLLDNIQGRQISFKPSLEDKESNDFKILSSDAKDGVRRTAMRSDLRDIFQGTTVTGFEPANVDSEADGVMVKFYVQLSENIDEAELEDKFKQSLRNTNFSLGGTEMFAARETRLATSDFDECSSDQFNDCSKDAECFNFKGTYTCSCKEGFTDLSPSTKYPGRECTSDLLGCAKCNYHGTCLPSRPGDSRVYCDCFHWYAGDTCFINLKVLLIALLTLGAVMLLVLVMCSVLTCMRKKQPQAPGNQRASGFMRYRGNAGQMRGTLDKTAMIQDTSSESSVDGNAMQYVANSMRPSGSRGPKGEAGVPPSEGSYVMEKDRSLTVMIPRAKYRPVQSTSVLSTFAPPAAGTSEQKLLNYLEGGSQEKKQRKGSGSTERSRKQSAGALVSAGFEVSAHVSRQNDQMTLVSQRSGRTTLRTANSDIEMVAHRSDQMAAVVADYRRTTAPTPPPMPPVTMSEARSYDETLVQPAMRSRHGCSTYGSKPGSSRHDEGQTMAERDIGSTFMMPQSHLYKPARRDGSEASNFDSL